MCQNALCYNLCPRDLKLYISKHPVVIFLMISVIALNLSECHDFSTHQVQLSTATMFPSNRQNAIGIKHVNRVVSNLIYVASNSFWIPTVIYQNSYGSKPFLGQYWKDVPLKTHPESHVYSGMLGKSFMWTCRKLSERDKLLIFRSQKKRCGWHRCHIMVKAK